MQLPGRRQFRFHPTHVRSSSQPGLRNRVLVGLVMIIGTGFGQASWLRAQPQQATTTPLAVDGQSTWSPIPRRLPPLGDVLEPAKRAALTERLGKLQRSLNELSERTNGSQAGLTVDVEVFLKAVAWALELGEFYEARDAARADELLAEAERRMQELAAGQAAWTQQTGLVVRGYRSVVDRSVQPYGLVIPTDYQPARPAPLYVWLHGRGDKTTDLHFIHQRMKQVGQIAPAGAIVLHPFGRHCLGFKSAGETDVLEAIADVQKRYAIDTNRVVLIGFSMGGAGAWHLGAHYADRWVAVSPGAGFAETARYQRLNPADYPPSYEQALWGLYDVPHYVRNLFQVPVIAYSGELDKQIQAAQVMEAAYREEGRELTHLIGPGVEHRYHPETLAELLRRVAESVERGREPVPTELFLQTRTLRYAKQYWLEALGLGQHWQDARIDGQRSADGKVTLQTKNITRLRISLPAARCREVKIDGQSLVIEPNARTAQAVTLQHGEQGWEPVVPGRSAGTTSLQKQPGLQGPMDDAFIEPFLVVTPTRTAAHPPIERWVRFELDHLRDRWRGVFRGELPEKPADQVTADDVARYHLILWGDPSSNVWIQRFLMESHASFPLRWDADQVRLGEQMVSAAEHLPMLIYPSPFQAGRYVVLNSGPTFREDHDRTNSLQNPKLPDWTLLRITQAPTSSVAGEVIAADFFNEHWQLR